MPAPDPGAVALDPAEEVRLRDQVLRAAAGIARAAAQVLGVPDYPAYLEHHRRTHADGPPPMSREEFFRSRLDHRYGGRSGGRCC